MAQEFMNERERMQEFFDGLAPHWDDHESTTVKERRDFLASFPLEKGQKVLDLACGTGIITPLLAERVECPVDALDLSPEMIAVAKKKAGGDLNLRFMCGDFYSYEGGPYDWIIVYNAYPHFMDVAAFTTKASALLKKGGRLLILHSLSRHELALHHGPDEVAPLSRLLLAPESEAKYFRRSFVLERAEDGRHHYILQLRKI